MTDVFANAAQTVLAGNGGSISAGATTMLVASSSLFPVLAAGQQFRVIVDSEYMIVTAISGTTWTVTRAAEGSVADIHTDGALVTAIVTAGVMSAGFVVYVQPTAPVSSASRYLWIQTGLGDGDGVTYWVEDGS